MRWLALLTLVAGAASGCYGDRPKLRGDRCELNTDCEAPLVCGFGRCRRECRTHRDCAAQLDCFLDARGLGYCQLEQELECTFDADCEAACAMDAECVDLLACRDGRCARECMTDRDCPDGSSCEENDGRHTCEVPERDLCIYDSECPEPYVCARDQQCRYECEDSRDCDVPRECVEHLCVLE